MLSLLCSFFRSLRFSILSKNELTVFYLFTASLTDLFRFASPFCSFLNTFYGDFHYYSTRILSAFGRFFMTHEQK